MVSVCHGRLLVQRLLRQDYQGELSTCVYSRVLSGAVVGLIVCWLCGLVQRYDRIDCLMVVWCGAVV